MQKIIPYSRIFEQEFISKFDETQRNVLDEIELDLTDRNANIDVEMLADLLGYQIVYDLMKESGQLEGNVIKVSVLDAEVRQRFTIAHEIAHIILHKPESVMYRDTNLENYEGVVERMKEREANQFAAELLMPQQLLLIKINDYLKEKEWESTLDSLQFDSLLSDVSRQLQVSKSSLEYRLINLGVAKEG